MECAKNRQIDWSSVRSIVSPQVASAILPRLLLILTILILLGTLLQACSGSSGTTGYVTNLKSITIDPIDSSIAVSTKVQLHATGTYKNETTKDITDLVAWETDDPSVTIVSNLTGFKGLAAGVGVGATTVRARLHGIAGVSAFTVTKATLTSITVQPVNPFVSKGATVQLAAVGNFSDGSVQNLTTQVSWSSANSSIAQVSNTAGTMGLVTGVSVGNAPITAIFNGISGSTTVTVTAATLTSITINVAVETIAKGTTLQLTATCNFSDGTTLDCTNLVSWTSGNNGIASVSDTSPTKGLVTGVGVGSTTISGSFGGITGSATVTVTAATLTSITITPPDPSIAKGTTVQETATGNFSDGSTQDLTDQVSWISSDETIEQVSNVPGTQGVVTGLSVGSASISATLIGIQGSTTVTVTAATLTSIEITPPDPSIANGTTVQLTATGDFSDGTTQDLTAQVSWSSGNNDIAEVDNVAGSQGVVTGRSVGSTSITATLNGVSGSVTVTVTDATLTSIQVTPAISTIAKGTTVQLTAICNFSDLSTQICTTEVGWTSNNEMSAQVSPQGLVTGIAVGSSVFTTITATLDTISGSAKVTVTDATLTKITVVPAAIPSIPVGHTLPLKAIGTFSDGTTQDLTTQVSWSPSNGNATVSNTPPTQGLVQGIIPGSTIIKATLGTVSGSITVTVTSAVLTSITVAPADPSLAKGTFVGLTATGTFSDGSMQDLTPQASWTSNAVMIAPVGNGILLGGLVYGRGQGSLPATATITATFKGIKGLTTVTVTPATLVAIVVTPVNPTVNQGASKQLIATGFYSDLTHQDITESATWIPLPEGIVTVGSSGDQNGLVTGVAVGTAKITAQQAGITGSTMVTVVPAPEFAYVTNDTTPSTVSVFSVGTNGALTEISGSPFPNPGSGALSVTADPSGKFLYTTNFSDGTVTAYAITQSGSGIGSLTLVGSPPPNPVSSGGGAFGIAVVPTANFAYVANFSAGTISGFMIDPSTGALSPVGPPVSAAPIVSPRGVAAHPNGRFIYVTGYSSNNVAGYIVNATGALTPMTSSPFTAGLPGDEPFSVTLDPFGNHLFTVNFSSGNVSDFRVNSGGSALTAGALSWKENATTMAFPINIAVDPKGEYAYVVGTTPATGSIESLHIVEDTLEPSGTQVAAGINPRSVVVDPSGKFVYAADLGFVGLTPGGVFAYSTTDGVLTPITPSGPAVPGLYASSITVIAVP
jgi:trimeric autotransporter adhesin